MLILSRGEIAARARAELERRKRAQNTKQACEESFHTFLRHAWQQFEGVPFVDGWHIQAMCEHLEAMAYGEISNLLINVPPRSAKTSICVIAFNAWIWCQPFDAAFPRMGPQVRFLFGAYSSRKAQQDAITCRRLIDRPWYRGFWGERVRITPDRDNAEEFDTSAGGARISVGIPESLGKGGLIRILDDPQKSDEPDAADSGEKKIREYDEVWSTRGNDPMQGAEMIVMQRLGVSDLSGHVLQKGNWTHLCIPAEYEASRHCVTVLGLPGEEYEWHDPRGCDEDGEPLPEAQREANNGEPFWPERLRVAKYPNGDPVPEDDQAREWCRQKAADVGRHAWAGQFQQRPSARGGSIIDPVWWRLWEGDYPLLGTVIVSYDGATGLKQINDYSACTVWGTFAAADGRPQVLLLDAWRMRAPFHEVLKRLIASCMDARVDRHPDEVSRRLIPGLGEVSIKAAPRWEADYLLIENKGPGGHVAQEVVRLMGNRRWNTVLVDPGSSDKVARLQRVEHLFENGTVFAPETAWAQAVIEEVADFPKVRHDDYTDTVSQALGWLRGRSVVITKEEHDFDREDALLFRREPEPLYDV